MNTDALLNIAVDSARQAFPVLNKLLEVRKGQYVDVRGVFEMPSMAQAAIDAYLKNFHPTGYGTFFQPIQEDKSGLYWTVKGERYASCD